VAEAWVVNASPLIALGRIGRLDLLTELTPRVVVPSAVKAEVLRLDDAASRAFRAARSLQTPEAESTDAVVSMWGLGAGETEVITYAKTHPGFEAIVGDLAARRCAAAFGIATRGTLGVVLLAKKRGLLPSAAAVLGDLQAAGLYLSAALVKQALDLVGEGPL